MCRDKAAGMALPQEFMPILGSVSHSPDAPESKETGILLDDPEAQSVLIMSSLFKKDLHHG